MKKETKEEYFEPVFKKESKEEGAEEMKKEVKEEEPVVIWKRNLSLMIMCKI